MLRIGRIRRGRLLSVTVLASAIGWSVFAPAADSHKVQRIFKNGTYDPSDYIVDYYFDASVPGGRVRSRIIGGGMVWNELGRKMFFQAHRPTAPRPKQLPPIEEVNPDSPYICPIEVYGRRAGYVDWVPLGDSLLLGNTDMCYGPRGNFQTGRLNGFWLQFNSDQPWYRKKGHTDNEHFDVFSIAAHELGHTAGFAHHFGILDSSTCGSRVDRHTMCDAPLNLDEELGRERYRSLEKHDIETFNAAYPSRCGGPPDYLTC